MFIWGMSGKRLLEQMNDIEPIHVFYGFAVALVALFFFVASFFNRKSDPCKGERMNHFRRGNRTFRNSAYAKMDEEKITISTSLTGKTFVYRFDEIQELVAQNDVSFAMYTNQRQFIIESDRDNVIEFGGEWGRLVSELVEDRRVRKNDSKK
jgi:hypothetical protein